MKKTEAQALNHVHAPNLESGTPQKDHVGFRISSVENDLCEMSGCTQEISPVCRG